MDSSLTYEERHNALVGVEDSKDDLIKVECISDNAEAYFPYKLQDLMRENADLTRMLGEKSSDWEREVNNCRSYHQQNHDQARELDGLRRKMVRCLPTRSRKTD